MTDQPDALLPCPFCGSGGPHNQFTVYGHRHHPAGLDMVRCLNCLAEAPANVWNKRPTPPSALELARELETLGNELETVGIVSNRLEKVRALLAGRPQESAAEKAGVVENNLRVALSRLIGAVEDTEDHGGENYSGDCPVCLALRCGESALAQPEAARLSAEGGERGEL